MTDQCQHCVARGDIAECEATDCGFHEGWAHQHWRRRALVAEALLGCAVRIVGVVHGYNGRCLRADRPGDTVSDEHLSDLLATDPAELMRLVPETAALLKSALAARGLKLEDIDHAD